MLKYSACRNIQFLHKIFCQCDRILESLFVVEAFIDAHLNSDCVLVSLSPVYAEKVIRTVISADMESTTVMRQALIDGVIVYGIVP